MACPYPGRTQIASCGKRTRRSECLFDDPASDRPRKVAGAAPPPSGDRRRGRDHLRSSRRAAVRPRRPAQPVAMGSHEEPQSPQATTRSASSSRQRARVGAFATERRAISAVTVTPSTNFPSFAAARPSTSCSGAGAASNGALRNFRHRGSSSAMRIGGGLRAVDTPGPYHGDVAGGQPPFSSASSGGPLASADQLRDCLSQSLECQ